MKIQGNQPSQLRKQEQAGQVEQKKGQANGTGEKGQISSHKGIDPNSFTIGKMRAKADATPDVDMDKVKALKDKIKAGTYQVDSKKLADNLMKESLIEDIEG